jgi:hypothetical protein
LRGPRHVGLFFWLKTIVVQLTAMTVISKHFPHHFSSWKSSQLFRHRRQDITKLLFALSSLYILFASATPDQTIPQPSNSFATEAINPVHTSSTSKSTSTSSTNNLNMANPMDSNPQTSAEQLDRVCIIGSGNWGSAIATKVGLNCERLPYFENRVNMWVFEEMVEVEGESRKLTEVINSQHENVKYLPGIKLPENIIAVADLAEACRDATLLIFVLPHQFLPRLLPTIREACHPSCRGVSLIKGLGKSWASGSRDLRCQNRFCLTSHYLSFLRLFQRDG